MQLTPVKSSQIRAVGFDLGSQTLAVQFQPRKDEKEGWVYHYQNVDRELYEALLGAESVGSFFYKTIKPFPAKYPYTRIS